ncbi:hypothetical protein JRQ81_018343 [Phrynocephalus forsythii]|uniref:Dual specificity phosphatase catalytic domain-containing protein n=1 Tax=Phrynocephalus forsythii TaxID=171643 RepID=A0A9Q0XSN8_9SAUR|nr:hypothetical protein JRQ81_018343 [Phrynocephalus forsythii]
MSVLLTPLATRLLGILQSCLAGSSSLFGLACHGPGGIFKPFSGGSRQLHLGALTFCVLGGVSRAAAIVIGFLMHSEGLSFSRAFSLVKNARPAICPNPGFMEQLHKYHQCSNKNGNLNDAE